LQGELFLPQDDLEIQTVDIHGGNPGQEEAKKNTPGLVFVLSKAKLVEGQELQRVSPAKGLNRLPESTRQRKAKLRRENFAHTPI
jgi:hypothetical protein